MRTLLGAGGSVERTPVRDAQPSLESADVTGELMEPRPRSLHR